MIKTLLLFLLMLTLITLIHEFGHFIMAKAFGVYVYEFSIGMGPKIISKKGKETRYTLRAFLIGGYVAMAGEDDKQNLNDVDKDDIEVPFERTLNGIKPLKKIIVMVAGVVMNFILAIVIMAMTFLSVGYINEASEPIIDSIVEDYPAYKAGIEKGDKITSLSYDNGYSIKPRDFNEVSNFFSLYDGVGNVHIGLLRGDKELLVDVKPQFDEENNSYVIGITSTPFKQTKITFSNCFTKSLTYLFSATKMILVALLGLFRGVGLNNLSGPVGVYNVTSEAVSYGAASYMSLIALISLNVGIFNLLPLPIFDGGRILITFIEMIVGKPLDKKIENAIMSASIVILLLLVVFVTFKDITKLIG